MNFPVEWHESAVKKMEATLFSLLREKREAEDAIKILERRMALRIKQIEKAHASKIKSFDAKEFVDVLV